MMGNNFMFDLNNKLNLCFTQNSGCIVALILVSLMDCSYNWNLTCFGLFKIEKNLW